MRLTFSYTMLISKLNSMIMDKFTAKLREETNSNLDTIKSSEKDSIVRIGKSIEIIESALSELREFTLSYTFVTEEEEIKFFKQTKPYLLSTLIFYRKIYQMELNRPKAGLCVPEEYWKKQLETISQFHEQNKHYYHYYRCGHCYLDRFYFLRNTDKIHLGAEEIYVDRDPNFSTYFDLKISEIIACDLLEGYLINEVEKIKNSDEGQGYSKIAKADLIWTGPKIDLIELVYALHEVGHLNCGKKSLKATTNAFEVMFGIELDNVSRGMYDLRIREKPSKFLDELRKSLLKRLDSYEK